MRNRLYAGLAVIAACATLTATPLRADPVTVIDTLGRTITLPAKINRILLGFYYEDFYAIGGPDAFDRVVAISRSTWQDWRNSQWKAYIAVNPKIAEITDVGETDGGTFSIETAIAAKPDIAIIAAWQYKALGNVVAKLEAAGIPVAVADYNAQTVEKHVVSTLMIGQIVGAKDRAQRLADEYAAAVADVEARVLKAGGAMQNVYVEIGNKGPAEYGNSYGKGMWGGVIELAGGNNIAKGQIANTGPLNPEYVIASNPAIIFIGGSYWTNRDSAVLMGFGVTPEETRARLQPYTKRPGWENLAAVKSGQVHALYHGGARTLYDYAFLQYVAKVLHPEAFADIDPVETHQRFYRTYLPIKADGTFMIPLAE